MTANERNSERSTADSQNTKDDLLTFQAVIPVPPTVYAEARERFERRRAAGHAFAWDDDQANFEEFLLDRMEIAGFRPTGDLEDTEVPTPARPYATE